MANLTNTQNKKTFFYLSKTKSRFKAGFFYTIILFIVISVFFILFFSVISKNNWGIIFSVFILMFSFGILRFHSIDIQNPKVFENKVGQK
jgi:VIT1/CCC1 family predicted Fe2+/Mn2+ transporter